MKKILTGILLTALVPIFMLIFSAGVIYIEIDTILNRPGYPGKGTKK